VATLRVGKDVVTAIRRTEKDAAAELSDDSDVIVQGARPTTRIQNSRRTVAQRTEESILSSERHSRRRWRRNFLFERRTEDKPVGCQVIFPGHIGEKVITDVELRVYVQIDKSGANDFDGSVNDPIRAL